MTTSDARRTMKFCGNCAFYERRQNRRDRGHCHGNPPQIVVVEKEQFVRPNVNAVDRACRLWQSREWRRLEGE